jgi:hypothetical protein
MRIFGESLGLSLGLPSLHRYVEREGIGAETGAPMRLRGDVLAWLAHALMLTRYDLRLAL